MSKQNVESFQWDTDALNDKLQAEKAKVADLRAQRAGT